jgi:AAA15 family ATPase/GTPase
MEVSNLYIKHLKIDNYKSLRNSTIELQNGLNVIIGKNGAGKSNLLDFIYSYLNPISFFAPPHPLNSNFSVTLVYKDEKSDNILSIEVEKSKREEKLNGHSATFGHLFTVTKEENKKIAFSNKKITLLSRRQPMSLDDEKIAQELNIFSYLDKQYIEFKLPEKIAWISNPSRLVVNLLDARFEHDNAGFAFFWDLESHIESALGIMDDELKAIKGNPEKLRKLLTEDFDLHLDRTSVNSILPRFSPIEAIRFNPNLNIYANGDTVIVENLSVDFLIDGDWMPWSYLSDGTKRLFYIISECISLKQGTILIEEPELGIHPHQLFSLLDFLNEQSRTKQVIISTHSPLTLDILKEDELNRIIIAKYDKGTKFSTLDESQIVKAKKYMNEVGELSYYWLHSDLEK